MIHGNCASRNQLTKYTHIHTRADVKEQRCNISWTVFLFVTGQIAVNEQEPEFLQPLENHTVTQGRDVFFTCVVNHLGPYKVCVSGVEIKKFKLTCFMSVCSQEMNPGNLYSPGNIPGTHLLQVESTTGL